MAGYIGSKAVNLSTTGADINGDANIDGDLSFRDNDKIKLGAGSDLQIYHDGSDSIITDTGTGNLIVKTNGNNIQFEDNAGNDIFKVTPTVTNIYHGTSGIKLQTTSTGVDITGTLTSDGLTVDGDASIQNTGNSYCRFQQTECPTNEKEVVFQAI